MTDWKWRLMLFVPISANTVENRTTFARAFVDNGSRETLENERKMLSSAQKLALATTPSVQVAWGIETAVKPAMRDALKTLIDAIPQAQWYVTANVDLPQRNAGELIQSSRATVDGQIGTQFRFADALADLGAVVMEAEIL